jgi:hypothetical protein
MKSEIRNPKMDVDDLLHLYFHSEMPKPWPALPALRMEDGGSRIEGRGSNTASYQSTDPGALLVDSPSSIFNSRTSARSRLVLAASVALLFLGSWWLSQRFAAISPSPASSTGKMIGSKPKNGSSKSSRHSPSSPTR